ncbi:uncharacterized protein K444DRAFT_423596 [Hyaloscypha bicolor E]|uniref:Uncharacterized protein n=1 Tax=Hyaloscypha bicolor E TaxID=1095630 RepID=A0A2J6T7U8_9HELO|nr:uncharacterized protein K444DRAFT_423596 [Hyaloscypha bicolor E]PMD59095.1 hypothetical protein K444DRAFT_423596 [Hyaloscypha bicolor E]
MIALVAITREMFRTGRGWKMRSGQASLRIAGVRWDAASGRIKPPYLVMSLLSSLDLFEVIPVLLVEGRITAGRCPNAGQRRGGREGREGPASALRRERTQMSSHQRPARPAGQPRGTEFPSLAHSAWKTKGCRVGEGSRDALPGWASRWIVRRISGVLSWGWCLSLRRGKRQGQKQRNATKMARRTPHARRGTSTPLQCVALHPLARLALSLTLISQQNRTTGPHLSHLCLQRLGLPSAGVEHRRVEAWNFPDNGGEAIVAWSLAPNLVMADQYCIRPLTTRALFDLVFDSSSTTSGLQIPRRGAGERPAAISRR